MPVLMPDFQNKLIFKTNQFPSQFYHQNFKHQPHRFHLFRTLSALWIKVACTYYSVDTLLASTPAYVLFDNRAWPICIVCFSIFLFL